MEPTPGSANVPASAPANPQGTMVSGKRIPTILYAVAILLFLLPFVEIRCNDQKLVTASGVDLAFGFDPKPAGAMKGLDTTFGGNQNTGSSLEKKQDPNKFALAALGLGVLGLLFSFTGRPVRSVMSMVISLLAVIAMIALVIDVKSSVKQESGQPDNDGFNLNMQITAVFTFWFYLSLFAFVLAGWLGWKQKKPG